MIHLKNVTKSFPGKLALKNVCLEVNQGEIHAFLGPNGAGKSTTMKIIAGLMPADDGQVKVASSVGYLPEHPPLYPQMLVKDYLDFVNRIYGGKASQLKLAIDQCGLSEVKNRPIGHLSKGFQQRCGIAGSLIYDPDILVLDEPTVGLDPAAMEEIHKLIKNLSQQHTIFLSTHRLREFEGICDSVTIIREGETILSGDFESVRSKLGLSVILDLDVEKGREKLEQILKEKNLTYLQNEFFYQVELKTEADFSSKLLRELIESGVDLRSFSPRKLSLEEIFKRTTGDDQ